MDKFKLNFIYSQGARAQEYEDDDEGMTEEEWEEYMDYLYSLIENETLEAEND